MTQRRKTRYDSSSEEEIRQQMKNDEEKLSSPKIITSPRTPETLIIRTPTKPDIDSEAETCEKLQATLEKHGIERQNAQKFFKGLVKDNEFKRFYMASLDEGNKVESSEDEFNTPMTRSKLREIIQNSPHKIPWANNTGVFGPLPKFLDIPLPENDDDDDEYKPATAEDSFGTHENSGIYKETVIQDNRLHSGANLPISADTSKSSSFNETILQSKERSDVIGKRTRSKHSLESTSLDVLEAAFNPPDITEDMYDNNLSSIEDYDWQKWLLDLMKDDIFSNCPKEDNIDEDPDFNILADSPSEIDDLNDSEMLEIPTTEYLKLLDEATNLEHQILKAMPIASTPANKTTTLRRTPRKKKASRALRKKESVCTSYNAALKISSSQIELIEQQMQQHVQLLLQTSILSRNTSFEECGAESEELLYELRDISASQIKLLGCAKSYVSSSHLMKALHLVKEEIPISAPIVRLDRAEKLKRYAPIPSAVARVLGNTEVCMYKELLPVSAPIHKESQKVSSFTLSEDCLLAHGVAEMKGLSRNHFELISQHMMPVRTDKQLSARYRNVIYCRNAKDTVSPINKYNNQGILPLPNTSVKHVRPEDAKKPICMEGDLPCWVLALKPLYRKSGCKEKCFDVNRSILPQRIPQRCTSTSKCNNSDLPITVSRMSPRNYYETTKSMTQISVFQTYASIDNQISNVNMKTVITTSANLFSDGSRSEVNVPLLQSGNTATSQCVGIVSTAKTQPSVKYGRRKSAGKSIKRMRNALSTSSSSSGSDDDSNGNSKFQKCNLGKDATFKGSEAEEQIQKEKMKVEKQTINVPKTPKLSAKDGTIVPPIGGFLQKAHPKLLGKKSKMTARDISKIKSSAKLVRSLEDDASVLSDPNHNEKERIFANGYLSRVKSALNSQPGRYEQFLIVMSKFTDSGTSPVHTFKEISEFLKNWPDLVQGFVPFLSVSQARECGLFVEKRAHLRAWRFLRQLEIQFMNTQDHFDKILGVFRSFSETAIYREEDMLQSLLNLMKGYPHLQDELITFFESQPPPKILFNEDFEEVDLTEDSLKDTNAVQFEHATLPAENHANPLPSTYTTPRKRTKKRSFNEHQIPSNLPDATDNKENMYPEPETLEDEVNYDSDSEGAMTEDEGNISSLAIPPPNLAVINEDALSSSPFKRMTGENEPIRPRTPTGLSEQTSDTVVLSASMFPPYASSSSSFNILPPTPGKMPFTAKLSEPISNVTGEYANNMASEPAGNSVSENLAGFHEDVSDVKPDGDSEKSSTQDDISDAPMSFDTTAQCNIESSDITDPNADESATQKANQEYQNKSPDASLELSEKSDSKDCSLKPAAKAWTRNEDELLLTSCKKGISSDVFSGIAEELGRDAGDVEVRLRALLELFNVTGADHESEDDEVQSDSSDN